MHAKLLQVMSDSVRRYGQPPTRLLCPQDSLGKNTGVGCHVLLHPWDFLGKNTGVGCHLLFQGIFLTQELNPRLLHWQADSLPLRYQGSHHLYSVSLKIN